jgi:GTPase
LRRGLHPQDRDASQPPLRRSPEDGQERALLVGLRTTARDGSGSLEELARLVETAGAAVVGVVEQHRSRPNPAMYIGAGKVAEVRGLAAAHGADLVIFDVDLSPAQQRNLERALSTKVLDRTAVVLDIFAQRARSREGRLQVELAQMTYLLPRLTGRGVMLSRLGGGIGTRGPGETKLEVDRRRIRARITALTRAIGQLSRRRRIRRESRKDAALPVVALVGYTNAGKSTLLNSLTQADVFTANKLFATLDPTTRKVVLPNHRPVLLVDTVGFIQRLPHDLVAAFRATLEEVTEADLLVHVIDASHPHWVDQAAAVEQVLRELGAGETPRVNALNKVDRVSPETLRDVVSEVPGAVPISALNGLGLLNLLRVISQRLPESMRRVTLLIPYAEGGVLGEVYARGRVLRRDDTPDGIAVEVEVPSTTLGRLRPYLRTGPVA